MTQDEGKKNDVDGTPEELGEDQLEQVSGGAFTGYLKIGDIKGESRAAEGHKDWINLVRFDSPRRR